MKLIDRVVEETLSNGMRVLVLPRHQSPTVSLSVRFLVGSAQEESGRTGVAHLLEHMMFKGTKHLGTTDFAAEKPLREKIEKLAFQLDGERRKGNRADSGKIAALEDSLKEAQKSAASLVIKDEIDALYTAQGAQGFNASTGVDLTTYTISLPSNRLELWARIESERLRDPVMREFYLERDVVLEERRQTYETDPTRKLTAQFLTAAFVAHPYRRPVIGWEGDISYLAADDARHFYRTWYSPSNMVVAVAGDVDPSDFLRLVKKYFGGIPGRPLPVQRITPEPLQEGQRRVILRMDSSPRIMIGFHKPTLPHFDDYVFDLIDGILTMGRTSRLYRSLVEEKQLAVEVSSYNGFPGARYRNLFLVTATPRSPHSSAEVEAEIMAQLDLLREELVPLEEMNKVRNQLRAGMVRGLQSNKGLAGRLSYFEAVAGDWRYLVTHLERLENVTPEDLRDGARRYFRADQMTVATLESTLAGDEGAAER